MQQLALPPGIVAQPPPPHVPHEAAQQPALEEALTPLVHHWSHHSLASTGTWPMQTTTNSISRKALLHVCTSMEILPKNSVGYDEQLGSQ
jgi:hypothetical protein